MLKVAVDDPLEHLIQDQPSHLIFNLITNDAVITREICLFVCFLFLDWVGRWDFILSLLLLFSARFNGRTQSACNKFVMKVHFALKKRTNIKTQSKCTHCSDSSINTFFVYSISCRTIIRCSATWINKVVAWFVSFFVSFLSRGACFPVHSCHISMWWIICLVIVANFDL